MLKHLYKESLGLLTDFYQLTMAYAYWKSGLDKKRSVFHLFFRKKPFKGGFALTAGLEGVIDYIKNFSFNDSDLAYLATLKSTNNTPLFEKGFLDTLKNLKFTSNIDAIPEGRVVFPYEPLLRIEGALIECQLLESALLNLINFPSLIATKAARLKIAALDSPLMEFGLRRAQGIDGALTAARAAFIGGCTSTSNTLAGKLFGIPIVGTHSHSFVMVFDEEEEAFRTYSQQLPDNCILLVDTYNSLEGVKKAIKIALELKERGKEVKGIRLDSGDLLVLSQKTRALLNSAGLEKVKIFATNDLDEYAIAHLKRDKAPIDVFGVGTRLVTAYDQPALDGVYKLSAIKENETWKYRLKLSEERAKISNPGIQQVARYSQGGEFVQDVIFDIHLGISPNRWEKEELLIPIFREGHLVYEPPALGNIQIVAANDLKRLPENVKRLVDPEEYRVTLEDKYNTLKDELVNRVSR